MRKTFLAIGFILLLAFVAEPVKAEKVCTSWEIYNVEDNCDYSSGICAWNNWDHSNFRTDFKRKSCTDQSGKQWFEYTQTTYKHGCC